MNLSKSSTSLFIQVKTRAIINDELVSQKRKESLATNVTQSFNPPNSPVVTSINNEIHIVDLNAKELLKNEKSEVKQPSAKLSESLKKRDSSIPQKYFRKTTLLGDTKKLSLPRVDDSYLFASWDLSDQKDISYLRQKLQTNKQNFVRFNKVFSHEPNMTVTDADLNRKIKSSLPTNNIIINDQKTNKSIIEKFIQRCYVLLKNPQKEITGRALSGESTNSNEKEKTETFRRLFSTISI